MGPQGQTRGDVVFDHVLALGHFGQGDLWFVQPFAFQITGEQRQGSGAGDCAGLPLGLAAGKVERGKNIRLGELI